MTPQPLIERVHPTWAAALAPAQDHLDRVDEFLRNERAEGRPYLPADEHVLRAFSMPMDQVRVLIVGQDPYPTPGEAVGLAFSVGPGVSPPGSLKNIYAKLQTDLGIPLPTTGDLTPWTEQGVLLLNRVLTVQEHVRDSHRRKGWEKVTATAIEALAARGGPLVAILWGGSAHKLASKLGDIPRIESSHPSPLGAHKTDKSFIDSHPFTEANELLQQQGADPIDWSLS